MNGSASIGSNGGQRPDQVEHRPFALADAHVIEPRLTQDLVRRERRMQPAGDDRDVHPRSQFAHNDPRPLPLARGQRQTDQVGLFSPHHGLDLVRSGRGRNAPHDDTMPVLAEKSRDEGRANGGHGPLALLVDFEKKNLHGSEGR